MDKNLKSVILRTNKEECFFIKKINKMMEQEMKKYNIELCKCRICRLNSQKRRF